MELIQTISHNMHVLEQLVQEFNRARAKSVETSRTHEEPFKKAAHNMEVIIEEQQQVLMTPPRKSNPTDNKQEAQMQPRQAKQAQI